MKLHRQRTLGGLYNALTSIVCFCILIDTIKSQNRATTEKKACKDKLTEVYCRLLMENGACQNRVKRMMELCPRTCQFCDEYCKDFLPFLCPWWKYHHACHTHPQVLHIYCRKSCGICDLDIAKAPPKKVPCALSTYGCCWDMVTPIRPDRKCPDCKDSYGFCKTFHRYCFYGEDKKLMRDKCPKTCNKCKPLT